MCAHVRDALPTPGQLTFRTTCGRDVRIGRLALGSAEQPAWRVSLDVGHLPGQTDGTWAAFTPAEARLFAVALLEQAAAAEGGADGAASQVEVSKVVCLPRCIMMPTNAWTYVVS